MSQAPFTIEPLTPADREWVRQFVVEHWHAEAVVAHGQAFYPHQLPGFAAATNNDRVGLVTYRMASCGCEIMTLDSLRPGLGVGTAFVEAVRAVAQRAGCHRLWLLTTNDNLWALGFYQKRGFVLVAVHRGAVDKARQIKPSIPLIGSEGIPNCDHYVLRRGIVGAHHRVTKSHLHRCTLHLFRADSRRLIR